jgi:beta-1,4-N-acetylglucosaminyltransferase
MRRGSLLILCFGEGGHHAQARRLMALLATSGEPLPDRILCVTDHDGIALPGTEEVALKPLRAKHARGWEAVTRLAAGLASAGRALPRIAGAVRRSERVMLISLGPAFAFLPAILVRFLGGTVVHIETWSRISSRSLTGRLMSRVSHQFLIQSETLQALYPKALYVGRL